MSRVFICYARAHSIIELTNWSRDDQTTVVEYSGVGVMTDTLDFVKNLWGSVNTSMGLPGMAVPTLSLEELDKKINDLKAVEAWLNVNMGMLRGTIQALEVQRGTIATLKSVGATLSAAVTQQPPGSADENKSLLESIPYASAFLYPNAIPGGRGRRGQTP